MPRALRASVGGLFYHVLNRGNARATVFHDDADYQRCIRLVHQACARIPMRVIGYCLMPNHFHLLLWPHNDGDLSAWMQWFQSNYVQGHRLRYQSTGHIWQGRFKAFPIQEDDHLLAVVRYIERNALRANLVGRAQDWPWSSISERERMADTRWLDPGPLPRPADWLKYINDPQTEAELLALRRSVLHGIPFGSQEWVTRTAERLGLPKAVRSAGRPRKQS
jgi:putative transposase